MPEREGKSRRGFASMDPNKQREIASKGGRAAHEKGTAHEFNSDEAREAGRKGGEAVSRNRDHMSAIGRKGGEARGANSSNRGVNGDGAEMSREVTREAVREPNRESSRDIGRDAVRDADRGVGSRNGIGEGIGSPGRDRGGYSAGRNGSAGDTAQREGPDADESAPKR